MTYEKILKITGSRLLPSRLKFFRLHWDLLLSPLPLLQSVVLTKAVLLLRLYHRLPFSSVFVFFVICMSRSLSHATLNYIFISQPGSALVPLFLFLRSVVNIIAVLAIVHDPLCTHVSVILNICVMLTTL